MAFPVYELPRLGEAQARIVREVFGTIDPECPRTVLITNSRCLHEAVIRALVFRRIFAETSWSMSRIGRTFGKDHSTVHYWVHMPAHVLEEKLGQPIPTEWIEAEAKVDPEREMRAYSKLSARKRAAQAERRRRLAAERKEREQRSAAQRAEDAVARVFDELAAFHRRQRASAHEMYA